MLALGATREGRWEPIARAPPVPIPLLRQALIVLNSCFVVLYGCMHRRQVPTGPITLRPLAAKRKVGYTGGMRACHSETTILRTWE